MACNPGLCALDKDLGRHGAGIVVGSHGEAVGSSTHEGDDVVGLEVGEFTILCDEAATRRGDGKAPSPLQYFVAAIGF